MKKDEANESTYSLYENVTVTEGYAIVKPEARKLGMREGFEAIMKYLEGLRSEESEPSTPVPAPIPTKTR